MAESIAGGGTVCYGLVQLERGASAKSVASLIDQLPGVYAVTRQQVAANDRAMITTSFAQPVQIIALVGLVAGVLIGGIVLYTATIELPATTRS